MASAIGGLIRRVMGMQPDDQEIESGKRGPAPYPIGDNLDPIKYASYVRALLDEQRSVMGPLFVTWTQNILFLAGLQWWKYDPMTGTFTLPRLPEWKERPVRNLLLPIFKTFLGKVTKNRPVTVCIPGSTDPKDIQASQLGNEVLETKWFERKMGSVLRRALTWTFVNGNAWVMPFWNKDAGLFIPLTTKVQATKHDEMGNPVLDPQTGQPTTELVECPCDENGDPALDAQGNYDLEAQPAIIDIGDVDARTFSAFQVFPDIGAENDQDVRHFLIAEPMTLRECYQRWPNAQSVVPEDTTQIDRFAHLVSIFASGADTHIAASQTKRDSMVPRCVILHYFERPRQESPGGRHWVSVGDQVLESPGPLPDGLWPPLIRLKDVEVAGRYHAEATVTAGVGPQREYNERTAQIKEHDNLMSRGKWLVPQGSNIKRGQITNQPGEVIQHTPGLAPTMADIKSLPATVYEERDRCREDLQTIMGMHAASMGEAAPGVTSGRAFLTLQEADDTDLGPFLEMLENAVAEIGWAFIQLIQRYYTEERLLRISGKNNSFRVRSFKGQDLKGVVGVKPQAGSAFPWSASARQNMMIDLGSQFPGLFTDEQTGQFDKEAFRRLLPLGGIESLDDSADLDVSEALREEDIFREWTGQMDEMGEPDLPTPQPWQNHAAHAKQHAMLFKGASFFEWPEMNQHMMVMHWQATMMMLAGQQAMAQPLEGSGTPAPGPDGTTAPTQGAPQGAPQVPGPTPGPPTQVATEQSVPQQVAEGQRDVDNTRAAVAGPT